MCIVLLCIVIGIHCVWVKGPVQLLQLFAELLFVDFAEKRYIGVS